MNDALFITPRVDQRVYDEFISLLSSFPHFLYSLLSAKKKKKKAWRSSEFISVTPVTDTFSLKRWTLKTLLAAFKNVMLLKTHQSPFLESNHTQVCDHNLHMWHSIFQYSVASLAPDNSGVSRKLASIQTINRNENAPYEHLKASTCPIGALWSGASILC